MRHTRFILGSAAALAMFGGAQLALAQPAPDPTVVGAPVAAEGAPGFLTLDRGDGVSRGGLEVSYLALKDSVGDLTALRFEAHGQYVDKHSGFGGYVSLPISYISGSGDSATAIADVEVGGLFVKPINPQLTFVGRFGVSLPTASDKLEDIIASGLGLQSRLTDFYLFIPGGLSLRVGGSLLYRQDALFVRADLGLDANISHSGDGDAEKPAVRYNVGAGYDFGTGAITAELTNLSITGDNGATINQAAVGARFRAGKIQPYAGVVIPLDEDARSAVSVAITVGVDATL